MMQTLSIVVIFLICIYLNDSYNSNIHSTKLYSNKRIDYDDYINEVRDGRIIRIASRVQYDGTDFKGWQEQDRSVRTIQGVLSSVLSKRFNVGAGRTIVIGASRTDHGVHSNGQAIHFDITDSNMNTICSAGTSTSDGIKHLEYTVNRMLPDDIKLYNMSIASSFSSSINNDNDIASNDLWHARKRDCTKIESSKYIKLLNFLIQNLRKKLYISTWSCGGSPWS
jgi:hypothetical protein